MDNLLKAVKKQKCAACGHSIDEAARLCPYCGANPITGSKFDPGPLVERHFRARPDLPPHETILEFIRTRQSIVVSLIVLAVALFVFAAHQIISRRNQSTVTDIPAIPLTEVADLSGKPSGQQELALPDLEFEHEGQPRNVRILLVEPGALVPPQPILDSATASRKAGRSSVIIAPPRSPLEQSTNPLPEVRPSVSPSPVISTPTPAPQSSPDTSSETDPPSPDS